jgi:hypothetical protein
LPFDSVPPEDDPTKVTKNPWPGLTVVGDNCVAADEAALRDTAMRSYDVARQTQRAKKMHWVREGYR